MRLVHPRVVKVVVVEVVEVVGEEAVIMTVAPQLVGC